MEATGRSTHTAQPGAYEPRTFRSDFKRFFLRGLVVLLPSILTLWIVVKAYQFLDTTIAEPINHGIRMTMAKGAAVWSPLRSAFDPPPEEIATVMQAAAPKAITAEEVRASLRMQNIEAWWARNWYMNIIGLAVAIVAVYVVGRVLGGYLGRKVYYRLERMFITVPVLKQVYPYVKEIVDFLFGDDKKMKFNRVVAVEYPRKGIWSVGFQTSALAPLVGQDASRMATVFIPSSPTPFTGYTISLPREEIYELPVTVDQAIRFLVSGGVLMPEQTAGGGSPAGLDKSMHLPATAKPPPAPSTSGVGIDAANPEYS